MAELIVHDGTRVPTMPAPQDPDSVIRYTIMLRPDVWAAQTAYRTGAAVAPSSPNGYVYRAIRGGMSGSTEPTWTCDDTAINDGCVQWQAEEDSSYLAPSESIVSATWEVDDPNAVIADEMLEANKVSAVLSGLSPELSKVQVTVHFVLDSGEEIDRSFVVKVKQL